VTRRRRGKLGWRSGIVLICSVDRFCQYSGAYFDVKDWSHWRLWWALEESYDVHQQFGFGCSFLYSPYVGLGRTWVDSPLLCRCCYWNYSLWRDCWLCCQMLFSVFYLKL
jgi:hypothetical protein